MLFASFLPYATFLACSEPHDSAGSSLTDSGGADTGESDTGESDTAGSDTGPADSGNDSSGNDTGACATVNSGDDWAWSGECPQMGTPVVITVTGCSMSLDYDAVGGMTMGMPYTATIEGDTVTFANDNGVDGCVGTVESADKIVGECGDGCTYKLKR
jgi:hypothetical protein